MKRRPVTGRGFLLVLLVVGGCGNSKPKSIIGAPMDAAVSVLDGGEETDAGVSSDDGGAADETDAAGTPDAAAVDRANAPDQSDLPDQRVLPDQQDLVDAAADGSAVEAGTASDTAMPGDAGEVVVCPTQARLCSEYCSVLGAFCVATNRQFADNDACLAACTLPTWTCGEETATSGNSFNCRFNQAIDAEVSPNVACPRAGPDSTVCR